MVGLRLWLGCGWVKVVVGLRLLLGCGWVKVVGLWLG